MQIFVMCKDFKPRDKQSLNPGLCKDLSLSLSSEAVTPCRRETCKYKMLIFLSVCFAAFQIASGEDRLVP